MASNPIDSKLYGQLYTTDEMKEVFSDESLLQKWLDSWVSLAEAEESLKVIPEGISKQIKEKADYSLFDMDVISNGIIDTTHPLIVQIREFEKLLSPEAGGYIHWGATTQDIMDTAVVLQIKSAQDILEKQIHDFLRLLLNLAEKYKDVVMPGRTHGQHALPVTLGYKIAIWADEIGEHLTRLNEGKKRYLLGSFGGAAGTLASLGEIGFDVRRKYCENLGLYEPLITWHVQRSGFAEFSNIVAMISSTLGKIANEIINLQRSEIGEIEEGHVDGQIGSSTMPHKRNPMICEYVVGLTRLVQRNATLGLDAMVQEHERDMTFWTTEWSYIPQICIYTSSQVDKMHKILSNMIVHEDKMERNLYLLKGLIVSENLMLELGKYIGRQKAHDVIYDISMEAFEKDEKLLNIALKNNTITQHMSEEEVTKHLEPYSYIGLSEPFIKKVQERWTDITF
ncbi:MULTISPECIES: adenylosuccinate lyase [Mammaliicoccus]|uniref:adenylosuccinate lyase n=1 Tax=Mammaliicoccus TaxID=2803850 RepID=UPI000E69B6D9|nr:MULTISPECIES: adenylosuccinate lyase [Mammaliicoccus]RIO17948.1 adenylosuccinate lyase [Mammaliicoccus sciuri]